MNSFKKMFQKSDEDKTASLKHSTSMPYLLSLEGRTREYRPDSSKPAYRGKIPLKKSNIVYVERAPGILEINHGKLSQHTHHHNRRPTHADFDKRPDLLAKFPHSPEPTEGLPRSGFRAVSLNSQNIRPQESIHNSNTSGQQAYPSISLRKQRHEATVDQASANVLQIPDDHVRGGRLAERTRAKSSNSRSYSPVPPVPTIHCPRPIISRSAHSSRVNIRHVPSHVAIPVPAAPDHGHPPWPRSNICEFLAVQDPDVLCTMINEYPIAPLCSERIPEHLRPIRFDMANLRDFQKTFREHIERAVAQCRPLDARAGGPYCRIIDVVDIMGTILETGINRPQVGYR